MKNSLDTSRVVLLSLGISLVCAAGCSSEDAPCDPADPNCVAVGSGGEPGSTSAQTPANEAAGSVTLCTDPDLLADASGNVDAYALVTDSSGTTIEGEALDVDHRDEIEILGLAAYEVSVDGSCEPGVGIYNRFRLVKNLDKSTAKLLEEAAKGAVLNEVAISIVKDGRMRTSYADWTLTNVRIEETGAAWDAGPFAEEWVLSYERLELVYHEQDPMTGSTMAQPPFCWDFVANQACP